LKSDQTSEKAVILLSGGLDSATLLAMAAAQGFELYTLSFDYGQRAQVELQAARRLSEVFGAVKHQQMRIGLDQTGGSALMDDSPVPAAGKAAIRHGIPETYVPARNTVFLSFALGWAEVLGAHTIFIGANSMDYSGYPDCRPEYMEAFNGLAALATAEAVAGGRPVRVSTPLMNLTKAQIIQAGLDLGVDYGLTISCYDPGQDGTSCGQCESCVIRLKGFADAGQKDPVIYRTDGA
jgi:7-cyano-7-deazaguanine synthase